MNSRFTIVKFFLIHLGILFFVTFSKAQMLEEIPNPSGFTCSFFNGGENNNLFFEYVDFSYYGTIFYYDGMDLSEVPLPSNNIFSFYSNSYNDKHYFFSFDQNFVATFLEYDGSSVAEIAIPAGYEFSNYVANYNNLMFVTLFDTNFNQVLFSYDGTNLTEVSNTTGLTFSNFVTINDDLMFLAFEDANFNTTLYTYDGVNFNAIDTPMGFSFPFFAGELDDNLYFAFQDLNFNGTLFSFDGTTLTEIPNPPGFTFGFTLGMDDDALYFEYFDANFYTEIVSVTGNTATLLPPPAGFNFPQYATTFNGLPYFSFFDNNTFENFLFFWNGNEFEQLSQPTGFQYSFYADTLNGEPYFLFFDNNFNNTLTKIDAGTNQLTEVGNPAGDWNFENYATSADEKLFFSYFDNNFSRTLFMFDGTDFIEIPNPANQQYSFFLVNDLNQLYFRYDNNSSFLGTLYKLTPNSLPTGADNTVTTFINIPYFFEADDFDFSDLDGDNLAGILITEVEALGNLLNNGAHVYTGDHIDVADIPTISYFPVTGEEGAPYTYFKFKVFDGDDYSEVDYTMFINVVDPATSTFDVTLDADIVVFPNPTVDLFNLKIESKESIEALHLFLYTSTGQLVEQQSIDNIGTSYQHQFNVQHLPSGTYFLIGKTKRGDLRKRIVIQ